MTELYHEDKVGNETGESTKQKEEEVADNHGSVRVMFPREEAEEFLD